MMYALAFLVFVAIGVLDIVLERPQRNVGDPDAPR